MKSITKRQHYVWRSYLKPWLVENNIACYRKNNCNDFVTRPENVASEGFFYRIEKLSEADLQWISAIINLSPDPEARKLHRGTVNRFQLVHRIREHLSSSWLHSHSPGEIEHELMKVEKTIGEHYHSSIENMSRSALTALQNQDCTFYNDRDKAFSFIHFLTQQFFRTPRFKELLAQRIIEINDLDLRRTWFVESQIYSANVAAGIVVERKDFKFTFITNNTDIGFITGDQPVISLGSDQDLDLKFYYPLGPKLAVIFKKDCTSPLRSVKAVTAAEAEAYNIRIYRNAYDQIYGDNRYYLRLLGVSDRDQALHPSS